MGGGEIVNFSLFFSEIVGSVIIAYIWKIFYFCHTFWIVSIINTTVILSKKTSTNVIFGDYYIVYLKTFILFLSFLFGPYYSVILEYISESIFFNHYNKIRISLKTRQLLAALGYIVTDFWNILFYFFFYIRNILYSRFGTQ